MEKLLTIKQAADMMAVSVRYLHEHREIPRIQMPGRAGRCAIRFKPSDEVANQSQKEDASNGRD